MNDWLIGKVGDVFLILGTLYERDCQFMSRSDVLARTANHQSLPPTIQPLVVSLFGESSLETLSFMK